MLKRTISPKPPINRYGFAVAIALIVHLLIVCVFSLNLHSASVDSGSISQIQATLIDHSDTPDSKPIPPPPVKKSPPPPPPIVASVVKTKALPLEQAIDGTIEQSNTSTHKVKPTETPDKKADKVSQPLKKIKQLSMDKALEQEVQKNSAQANQKILSESLSAEISAESQKQQAAASANKAAAKAATALAANSAEINRYKTMILQQIQQHWIVPANVDQLSCELQVELAPGGAVLKVSLSHSSGNDALDRSAIAAVNKASPLPVPKNTTDFDAFRNFTITVKPA